MLSRFKELTEVLLPARAQAEHWPIRFDHCFKRICLDAAFEDCWYRHIRKPAELDELNKLSLQYRGKLPLY